MRKVEKERKKERKEGRRKSGRKERRKRKVEGGRKEDIQIEKS